MDMSRLTLDGTTEPISRDQTLRREREQRNIYFPCSADPEQDWQPYPVEPYSAICDDHTYIHKGGHKQDTPITTLYYLSSRPIPLVNIPSRRHRQHLVNPKTFPFAACAIIDPEEPTALRRSQPRRTSLVRLSPLVSS